MTITATRSWKSYNTLCSMLQKNDIPFERDDEDLRVCCCVSSGEKERLFVFETDPSKMLITLIKICSIIILLSECLTKCN